LEEMQKWYKCQGDFRKGKCKYYRC
jgi:hypothetical protein